MGKAILGIVVGFVLAGLLVLFWGDSDEIEGMLSAPSNDSRSDQDVISREESIAPTQVQAASEAASDTNENAASLDVLAARVSEAERELRLAQDALQRATELPPGQPISLPPEFDWLTENPSENHEIIQREPLDPAWSATAHSHLENFFTDRLELSEEFGYPTIHCRTTRCEAAFVRYGVDESDVAAGERVEDLSPEFFTAIRFRNEIAQNAGQPLIDQFSPIRPEDLDVNIEDGVTTILWHLSRREE